MVFVFTVSVITANFVKKSAVVPHRIETQEHRSHQVVIHFRKNLPLQRLEMWSCRPQYLDSAGGDPGCDMASIIVVAFPGNQLQLRHPIEQSTDVWHLRDQSLPHLPSAEPCRRRPLKDSEDIVLGRRDPEWPECFPQRVIEDCGRPGYRDNCFLGSPGKRMSLLDLFVHPGCHVE